MNLIKITQHADILSLQQLPERIGVDGAAQGHSKLGVLFSVGSDMDGADGVYPPSEDTFLLIDAISQDSEFLKRTVTHGGLCIEIGCGSGEVSEALCSIVKDSVCLSSDVNVLAVEKTRHLLLQRGTSNVDVLLCDLFTAFRPGTLFDVIVFNPPYVPTDQEELDRALRSRDIAASWAGGKDGREVIDRFLFEFLPFLSSGGLMYLVVLEANNPCQIKMHARQLGCTTTTVMKREAGIEKLYILRFQKN